VPLFSQPLSVQLVRVGGLTSVPVRPVRDWTQRCGLRAEAPNARRVIVVPTGFCVNANAAMHVERSAAFLLKLFPSPAAQV
jgi:hypothetical protein